MKHIALVHSNKDFTISMTQATAVMIFKHLRLHIFNNIEELSALESHCQVIFLEENCQLPMSNQNIETEIIVIKGQWQSQRKDESISIFSPISKWVSLLSSLDMPSFVNHEDSSIISLGAKKFPLAVLLEMRESSFQHEALCEWAKKQLQRRSRIACIDMTPLGKLSFHQEYKNFTTFYSHPVDAIEAPLKVENIINKLEKEPVAIYCEFNRSEILVPLIQMADDIIVLWGESVPDSGQLDKITQWLKWHTQKASLSLLLPYHRKQMHSENIQFIHSIETIVGETYEMSI